MSEIEMAKDYGFAMGQDAGMLRELGATDEQVRNYIAFHRQIIPQNLTDAYTEAARRGFCDFKDKFDDPVYWRHKADLQMYIDINAACLQEWAH